MKKTLSLLLALALLVSLVVPTTLALQAKAAEEEEEDKGLTTDKTAVYNAETGDYTITLEAYATGDKFITETSKSTPTDIVLVIDQSGSMKNTMSTTGYAAYTGNETRNSNLYRYRNNGGSNNLWYKDGDTYYSVSVAYEQGITYESYSKDTSHYIYLYNSNNLYAKVDGEYVKVTLDGTETMPVVGPTKYNYKLPDGTIIASTSLSITGWSTPVISNTDDDLIYQGTQDSTKDVYTYSYTKDGTTTTIGTSTGANTQFTTSTLYQKTTGQSITRLQATQNAVNAFIESVRTDATTNNVDHRIALVGFASDDTLQNNKYQNSELFIGSTEYQYGGGQINSQYKKALQDISEDTGYSNIVASVGALTYGGGTAINLGTEMANNVLNAYKDEVGAANRKKVVVVFTDGIPGIRDSDGDTKKNCYADAAIENTYVAKNTYKATVYTVGVFDGADASTPGDLTTKTSWGTYNDRNQTLTPDNDVANKFMHLMSSNYPSATSMTSTGSINPKLNGDSYYLSASTSTALNNIFQKIASQVQSGGSTTKLDENTVIQDIIAPQFQLPAGATAANITLETWKYNGADQEWTKNDDTMGAKATIDAEKGTVGVTGFDFTENYVGTETVNGTSTPRGNKLVIKFNVKTKDGFLGGNDVYTNSEAKIYASKEHLEAGNAVGEFPKPQVNVPIKDVTVTATDKNVYLLGELSAEQIKSGATVKCGDVPLDLTKADYGLESWQTEYVNITVTYTDASGNSITDLKKLQDDTSYTVTATISPQTNGSSTTQGTVATAKTNSATGKINVFKPELTFKDSEVWYGDNAPTDYTGNKDSEPVWKHGDTLSTDVIMIGTAPTLDLTYAPDADKISGGKINSKSDIPVDVTVKIDSTDVTTNTDFKHTNCTGKTCGKPNDGAFWLHVNTCTLTITKAAGTNTTIGNDEYFVFTVKKDGVDYTQVTIQGEGSVTISELPVGTYTIEEDTSVAWRYGTPDYSGSGALSSTNPSGNLICTNTKTTDNWLNHFSRVINTYGSQIGTKG